MARRWGLISFLVVVVCLVGWKVELASGELGVNWGTISSDPLPNNIVVQMLLDNKFVKVKLFDANSDVISSMKGTNLEVMVAITNDMLATMATSTDAAAAWVKQNVTAYLGNGGVNIKYVFVLRFLFQFLLHVLGSEPSSSVNLSTNLESAGSNMIIFK